MYAYFFTSTIKDWNHLLQPNKYKEIIIESLTYLTKSQRVKVYAFVLMPNHIHLIWEIMQGHDLADVQRDFLKYLSQQIKFDLEKNHPKVLEKFKVNLKDRKYRFWQDRSLSIRLYNDEIFMQKLHFIHENPL